VLFFRLERPFVIRFGFTSLCGGEGEGAEEEDGGSLSEGGGLFGRDGGGLFGRAGAGLEGGAFVGGPDRAAITRRYQHR